ncbi:MAG: tetratricopeptide repeat protein [Acidobacteriia bacterium]|nr:tetratricopeptide repeat protein [Terriglobia bacterium]
MKRSAILTVSILAGLLAAWFTSRSRPIPPVPTPSLEGADADVRNAVLMAYQQAVAAPDSGQASGHLGMVLQAHTFYQQAALSFERAIRLDPKEFAWRYDLALTLQPMSRLEEALDAISAALRIRPDYAPAVLTKGELLFQLGRFQKSAAAYESLLAQTPGSTGPVSAAALYGLARVKYAQQDLPTAEDLYRRACQAYPTFGAAYYGLASAQRGLRQEAEATKNFELAARYRDDRPPVPNPVLDQVSALITGANSRMELADQALKKGNAEQVARLSEETLQRQPDNFDALMNLLLLAQSSNRYDDRLDSLFAAARRISPQVPNVYNYYGVALARQGKYDAAAAALRKSIELDPDSGQAHLWLAKLLDRQNRPAEAIEQYQRALAADPSNRGLQMELWRILIVQGRGREALSQLLPALQTDDSHKSFLTLLAGEAYLSTGDVGSARQYLEQARGLVQTEGRPDLVAQIEQELKRLPLHR